MSQEQRSISLPFVGAILLSLFVVMSVVYMAVRKRSKKKTDPAEVVKHPVDTDPADALKYWTKEKMRKAKPAEMPNVDVSSRKKESAQD